MTLWKKQPPSVFNFQGNAYIEHVEICVTVRLPSFYRLFMNKFSSYIWKW
jgi:hypothetical protein